MDDLSLEQRAKRIAEDVLYYRDGYGYARRRIAKELAAAEERGRKAGLEEAAGRHGMNAEQLDRQRRSFAYGNAHLANPNITRQHIDEAAERLRKEPPAQRKEAMRP